MVGKKPSTHPTPYASGGGKRSITDLHQGILTASPHGLSHPTHNGFHSHISLPHSQSPRPLCHRNCCRGNRTPRQKALRYYTPSPDFPGRTPGPRTYQTRSSHRRPVCPEVHRQRNHCSRCRHHRKPREKARWRNRRTTLCRNALLKTEAGSVVQLAQLLPASRPFRAITRSIDGNTKSAFPIVLTGVVSGTVTVV